MIEPIFDPAENGHNRLKVPEGIRVPATIDETVAVCRNIFDASASGGENEVDIWSHLRTNQKKREEIPFDVATLVPETYIDLAKYLEYIYQEQYRLNQSFTSQNPYVEVVFQQLQIILDKENGRTRVNHFGYRGCPPYTKNIF